VQRIKALGKQAGVAINPATPAAALEEIVQDVDLVLVMTVNPGLVAALRAANLGAQSLRRGV
jgi:pentose-5-phosphate-3-epimerase